MPKGWDVFARKEAIVGGGSEMLVTGPLCASGKAAGSATQQDAESGMLIAHTLRAEGFDASEDGTGRGTPIIPVVAFDTTQITSAANRSNPKPGDPCHPLCGGGHPPAIAIPILESGARTGKSTDDPRAGIGIGEDGDPMYTLQSGKQHAIGFYGNDSGNDAGDEVSPTLRAMEGGGGNHPAVALSVALRGRDGGGAAELGDEVGGALRAGGGGGDKAHVLTACEVHDTLGVGANQTTGTRTEVCASGMAVRRLTPRECARLQGFPDDWTAITYRGKPAADGPQYKAYGNSMAVPVLRWILTRIIQVEQIRGEA